MSDEKKTRYELQTHPTARELIEVLSKLDLDATVIIPSTEGNHYRADGVYVVEELYAAPIASSGGIVAAVPADYRVHTRPSGNARKVIFIH